MLSDRGSRFYATESEKKSKGFSEFEKHLEEWAYGTCWPGWHIPRPTASWNACTARYSA